MIRIAKAISDAGICSRRDAEKMIERGLVEVNGVILRKSAFNVSENDIIRVNGSVISRITEFRIWRFYKPAGVIITNKDPQNRPTIFGMLPKNMPRVISIGRLDFQSEGLLLLTNSGSFARSFELPSSKIQRIYHIKCYGKIDIKSLKQTEQGINLQGEFFRPKLVEVSKEGKNNHWLKIVLTEGKNREIRKILAHFGLKISRLIRVAYGNFELGGLKPSEIEEVKGYNRILS